MSVVLEGREEAFKVALGQSSLQNFFIADLVDESLHLINWNVTVLVGVNLLSKMLLESFLVFEAALKESVDSNQVALNILKLVCWNFLRVKDKHVSIKDILLDESAEVWPASAWDRVGRFRDDALICLHIVAESTQISSHFSVLDSTARLILEHKKIVMELVLLLLHSSSRLHSTIKNFHEITRVSCVGLVFVKV